MSSLDYLFKPKSVSVIGASRTPDKIGFAILDGLLKSGFDKNIYPVNPKEEEILNLKCYPEPVKIPEKVDLAIITVPDRVVNHVARQCGEAGVKALIVISAGFKEVGSEGLKREKELAGICEEYGMRMLGPNCVGMMDTHTPINASFANRMPHKGEIAFISQSGAMLVAILDWSLSAGIGFSKFISMGNKADLDETDFIKECGKDPHTKVILCYIEDVSNGSEFMKVTREVSKQKPIIIYKSGTSEAGAKAATSHTGALAGSDLAYNTAFLHTGVIRVQNMADLFDLAVSFVKQPIPKSNRVAIVTNAGGPGIIATDSIEKLGLKMARFERKTIEDLQAFLPPEANVYNPVDVLGDAKTDRYRFALEKVLEDDNVDNVVVLLCPTAVTEPEGTAQAIIEMKNKYPDKTVFAAYMGGEILRKGTEMLSEAGVPCFTFPEPAVSSIKGLVEYNRNRERLIPVESLSFTDLDQTTVKATLFDVYRDRRRVLLGSEAARIAKAYGIPANPAYLATTSSEVCRLCKETGFPVVLKVASPAIVHKTDIGGVRVGINTEEEAREAFHSIMDSARRFFPNTTIYGVEVQKMMSQGIELIIGMSKDIQFGPLIAFGLGGIYVNLLKDISFRLANGLTQEEIFKMISETKAHTLLRGYRGSKPADIEILTDTIARVARLCLDFTEIAELDINPIFAYEKGAAAIDVKITLGENV